MLEIIYSVSGLIVGSYCAYKADQKNRSTHEWFLLGFLFSIAALAIIAALKKRVAD